MPLNNGSLNAHDEAIAKTIVRHIANTVAGK